MGRNVAAGVLSASLSVAYLRKLSRYQSKSVFARRNAMRLAFRKSVSARSFPGLLNHSARTTHTSLVQPVNSFHGSIRILKLPLPIIDSTCSKCRLPASILPDNNADRQGRE